MAYVGFHPYIDAVRAVLRRHRARDPLPVAIGQLDYDVGYEPAIEAVKEQVSKHGWNLYKPNLRLALISLVATKEVRAREHAAFEISDDGGGLCTFETRFEPDAFKNWHQFMNSVVKELPNWAHEVVDLATTEIRGQFSQEDMFDRVRKEMCNPAKSLLNAVVYSMFREMRMAPAEEPMQHVRSGSVVVLHGRTDLAERWNNERLLCLYDLEPNGAISTGLVEKCRSLALNARAGSPVLASNKLTATNGALLNAGCGVPSVILMGFGEVVATSDLQESENSLALARLFGVL
jgi:hypothetical protein